MKIRLALVTAVLLAGSVALAQPAPQPQQPAYNPLSPIPQGAKPTQLATGFKFTEGATSDKDGAVYFIDQPNDRIMRWTWDKDAGTDLTKGKLEVFLHPSGYSNGMCFDPDGNLISCADEKNELWSIAAPFPPLPATAVVPAKPAAGATAPQGLKPEDLKITHLITEYKGKPLNGPNDVWVIPKGPLAGGMYITDPLYARDWWVNRPGGKGMQQPGNYTYFLSPDHKTLTPVSTDLKMPNGIIGTPDGKTLYISNINGGPTWSYTIKDDGTLADKKSFCPAGSDGMTIDSDGNIYTTAGNARTGLQIWSKEGKLLDKIPVGCANCCFGGKDKDILFIDSSTAVYGIRMKTHGVGPS